MPYIHKADRAPLDPIIDDLAQTIVDAVKDSHDAAFAGLLNYVCTRLAMKIVKLRFGTMRYWIIALITGALHNVADEFYRRVGIPYEDAQIERSGDVDLYAGFAAEIKGRKS